MRPSAVAKRKGAAPKCNACNLAGSADRLKDLGHDRKSAAQKAWETKRAKGVTKNLPTCHDCQVQLSRETGRKAKLEGRVARCRNCASKAMDRTALAKKAWETKRAKSNQREK